ncbi:ERBB receptor feedback inhibitor 1 [Hippocampus zosterae]|uniref:ERBB receptor feedback inhibitor 1 n=1 Tax=Hippocampus zosterae TaxID=109293 RepID=UPI00223E0955|nr:ERBB receptor feedback inhibitor 1 [Hippocampus zosterae]
MSENNYWGQHDCSRLCLGLPSGHVEHNLTDQQLVQECSANVFLPKFPSYSDSCCLPLDKTLGPHEGDQVVPYCSSHRWTVFWGPQREAKPLPPLPDPEEHMSDEAADNEVEFFTSERRPLLPKSSPKMVCRNRGQVNPAYLGASSQPGNASLAFSWPGKEDKLTGAGAELLGVNDWPPVPLAENHQDVSWSRHPDYKLNSSSGIPTEKPQIPPRIPIPPKTYLKAAAGEEKPPKIPPRVPLVPPCPPRSPSPKSLPIYINGVMPATQSFAANPQYVSKSLLSERAPPAAQISPCIVPILKDGRQASATHYILLPPRQKTLADRRGRLLSEPARLGNEWQNN